MSTLKAVNLQNPASGIVNATLNANGTTTFGGVVTFATGQTFPNLVSSVTAGTGLTGGTITTSGTIALDTAYTDARYLRLTGGTMTGNITFAGTQAFPGVLGLAGGTMTGNITFNGTQTFPGVLDLAGGTMTGDITFSGTQTFPGVLDLAGGTMTGDITFSGTQAFPAQDLDTVTTAGSVTTNSIDVGGLTAAGLNYPLVDGTIGEVVATDGAGNLGWLAAARVVSPPASQGAVGNAGEIAADASYFYWYDGVNWQRVAAGPGGW